MHEPLVPNEKGGYVFNFEPDLHIAVYEHEDQSIRLFSTLAPMPEINAEEFLHNCMVGNLLGRQTGGAALGIDDSGKKLTLSYTLSEGVNYRDFRDAFEDFVNYSDAWRQEALSFAEVNREE
ncbi:MAG: hypothetical protein S4CHLAM81_14850 [Chlamydiales bacterium]|nr:hypothetical protein [Chlamydiales bacterium]MCH9636254.1 hypothetical protein [Chlamydiales bacterium]